MYAKYDMSKDVAIITGGAMGIGLVCAQRLAENGAEIILWDRDSDALEAAKSAMISLSPLFRLIFLTRNL